MTRSLAAVLADTAARSPDRPALIWESATVTYRQLWQRVRLVAGILRQHGIEPGDRVAVLVPNTPDFPAAYYGVLALGATVVPLNTQLRSAEIEFVLQDSGARALVCDASVLEQGSPAATATGAALFTVAGGHPAAVRLDAPGSGSDAADLVLVGPEDIAAILYTSGTTGHPKGAMLTHRNIVTNIEVSAVSPFAVRSDDVLLGCLPLSHTFGQTCVMGTCFSVGATLVLMRRFHAASALEQMARHHCTVFMGVPTMYHALLDAVDAGTPAPSTLRRSYSGGSALPVPVLEQVRKTLGTEVYEGYGLTETSPVVAYNQPGTPCRTGTVGLPITGVEVAVARADIESTVELLPAGETGEIVIRGHNVMAGYLGLPAATAAVLVDGWFRSGDLGVLGVDGYLSIVDRKKDVILRGGYNVYPREVEEVLLRHPAVEQAAVVGLPDVRHGEEVCAVVVVRAGFARGDVSAADLVAWCREGLAGYKCPRRVEFAEELPLGHSGKVLKRELVARINTVETERVTS